MPGVQFTLVARVLAYVQAHPGVLIADVVTAMDAPYSSVRTALQRLRRRGLLQAETVDGPEAGAAARLRWSPVEKPATRAGRRQCVVRVQDDERLWMPSPWVHPIRARVLGAAAGRAARVG